jgi:hypothetical protein
MKTESSDWSRTIASVTCPTGFFVLVLLVALSVLTASFGIPGLDALTRVAGVTAGSLLVLVDLLLYSVFVWCKPTHLAFDRDAHLQTNTAAKLRRRKYPSKPKV